jgi:chemotaxis protein MotA
MFVLIGILVVFGSVIGGYLMEHGKIAVLAQPAELLIIAGAATGTLLVANPPRILKRIVAALPELIKGSAFTKQRYLETLKMMYDLLQKGRKQGLVALEDEIENPQKSPILSKYPAFLHDHHTRDFVCDTMRMAITGGVEPFDMDQMMELDMDVRHQEESEPVAALSTVADSLPGLGIVAAVLGVVITMQSLGGPPEEIGGKVAAALVGTFLGILLCYGLVGPVSSNISKRVAEEYSFHYVLRVLIVAFIKGTPPIMAVEIARRAVPDCVRPTFKEVETLCRSKAPAGAPAGGKDAKGSAPAPGAKPQAAAASAGAKKA